MEINVPEVHGEVEAAFARYEAALLSNDVATLQALFWSSAQTIRYGIGENLHGIDEIGAFRAARSPVGLARRIFRTVITTYGEDFATASTLFERETVPGRRSGGRCRPGREWRKAGALSPRTSSLIDA